MAVLLQHGADVRALNKFEKTPVDIARDKGYDDILHLLQVGFMSILIDRLELDRMMPSVTEE